MSKLEGKNSSGGYIEIRADNGRGLRVIDQAHGKIHDGKAWSHVFEFSALGAGGIKALAIKADTGKRVHVEALISADNAGASRVFKNPAYTSGGAVAGVNNDFSIDTASPGVVVSDPTVSDAGTPFATAHFASGLANTGGGESGTRHEFIVTPDDSALVRFVAKNAGTNGAILLNIYEEA